MTNDTSSVNSILMGSGGRSASFKKHGDQVWGVIAHAETRQQISMDDSAPLFWEDGKPRMQVVVTLQTEEQDDDEDDGLRRVYVKVPSQMLAAMRKAVTAAGAKGIEEGGKFLVRYVSDAAPTRKGFNGQKQYFCKYEQPSRAVVLPDEDGDADVPDIDDSELPF